MKVGRPHVAWFVTPHGFGHATRAAALMDAMTRLRPEAAFEVFTTVPEWVFRDSVRAPLRVHPVACDVGLVQDSPLTEDLPATVEALHRFVPFPPDLVRVLGRSLRETGCSAVACDVSPLGIAAARAAGLPSVLVGNFTWDWIYEGYVTLEEGLRPFVGLFRRLYRDADVRIEVEPPCRPHPGAVSVPLVAREARTPRGEVRRILGVPDGMLLVLPTLGGIPATEPLAEAVGRARDFFFVVPGGAEAATRLDNALLLPRRSQHYHPDLMAAADVVVGKLGYGTVAEAYRAGTRFGFVERTRFRESAVLRRFVEERMACLEVPPEEIAGGDWVGRLPALMDLEPRDPQEPNGAEAAARALLEVAESGEVAAGG